MKWIIFSFFERLLALTYFSERIMNTNNKLTRRQFTSRAVAAAASVSIVPRYVIGKGETPPSEVVTKAVIGVGGMGICLLYTSPSPRDATLSRMPSSA